MKGAGYMHRCNIKSKLKIMIEVVNLIFLLGAFLGYISCLSAFSDILIYKKNVVNDVKTISTVEFDMESIKNNKSGENVEIRNPSYDEFVQLANSPDVKSHEINYIDSILSTSLRDIDKDARVGLFNVKGVDKEYFYDLLFENIYLESGRSFSLEELQNADNKLIISNIVAENNNIKVGETLNLEICNPSNAEQHITREFIVIGVFSPKISNNRENENIEINNTIKQFLDHTHSHDEEDEHANEYYRSDQDRMRSLEKFLLIEDVNTIYMPNTTAIKLKALCSSKIICLIFTTFLILSFFHFMHNIFNDSFIFLAKLTILTWLFYIYHTILFRKRAMRFLPHPLSFLTYLRFRSISIP